MTFQFLGRLAWGWAEGGVGVSKYKMSGRRRHAQSCRVSARKNLPKIVAEQDDKCHYCGRFVVAIRSIPDYLRDEKNGPHIYFRSLEGDLLFALFATIDHVTPLSKNGSNRRENLVASCFRCNQKRRPEAKK